MTHDTKICEYCMSTFQRPSRWCNDRRWASRRFCCRACDTAFRNKSKSAQYLADLPAMYAENDGCWLFTGSRFQSGYGRVHVAGKTVRAHRFFYELHNGPIPDGAVVRHSCDNPICVNPAHLSTGSHADNKRDAVERDRHAKGEAHPAAKLTDADVSVIRSSKRARADLAAAYRVSTTVIGRVQRRQSWAHVPDAGRAALKEMENTE